MSFRQSRNPSRAVSADVFLKKTSLTGAVWTVEKSPATKTAALASISLKKHDVLMAPGFEDTPEHHRSLL